MASFRLIILFPLCILTLVDGAQIKDDCELHRPTIEDFCCGIYDEDLEFMDCLSEWSDKLDFPKNKRAEMVLHFCIAECTYNETEFLKDDKSLDMRIVKSHLKDKYEDENFDLMFAAFKKCEKHGKDMLKHEEVISLKKRLTKAGCTPYAGLVMECVSNELILNCPADEWNDSTACDNAKNYLKMCVKN